MHIQNRLCADYHLPVDVVQLVDIVGNENEDGSCREAPHVVDVMSEHFTPCCHHRSAERKKLRLFASGIEKANLLTALELNETAS